MLGSAVLSAPHVCSRLCVPPLPATCSTYTHCPWASPRLLHPAAPASFWHLLAALALRRTCPAGMIGRTSAFCMTDSGEEERSWFLSTAVSLFLKHAVLWWKENEVWAVKFPEFSVLHCLPVCRSESSAPSLPLVCAEM